MTEPVAGLAGVILAAGGSTRLGQPKQLLMLNGKTLIEQTVEQALSICGAGVVVVTGANNDEITTRLQGHNVQQMHNPDWQTGMAGSLRVALQALEGVACEGALLMVCDQPRVSATHLATLAALWQNAPSRPAAAAYDGLPGVPAIVPRSWFVRLQALQGDEGARGILRSDPDVQLLDLPEAAIDIDTPDDLFSNDLTQPD